MLDSIHVKNIALIKEIDIEFGKGLNIITGETGAGKSLIIGSVSLGLGAKVSKDYIYEKEKEAIVELTFIDVDEEVINKLKENDIDCEENTVVIQRKITSNKTTNKINFTSVSLKFLREIGSMLMQIHGQHDNQILLNSAKHIEILDLYAGDILKDKIKKYRVNFKELLNTHAEIKRLEKLSETRNRDLDYYSYVLEEIEDVDPQLGEDEKLSKEYKELIDLRNSYESINEATAIVENIVDENLSRAVGVFSTINELNDRTKDIYESLVEVEEILSEIYKNLSSLRDDTEFDEDKFENLDERIDNINNLKRKYGSSIEKIIEKKVEAKNKIANLKNMDADLESLKKSRIKLLKITEDLAREISGERRHYAKKMEDEIIKILEELNFLQVKFEFIFNENNKLTANGKDETEMYISTNVGHELRPLSKVSSGGELSRIMLAIQSMISDIYSVSSIIFDEVDAGISGKTGVMVAKRLKEMSKNIQIICITHLPQLAAVGDVHYKIEKDVEEGMTVTKLNKLDEEQSISEVARLLGGIDITEATLQNARELKNSLN